MTIKRYQENAYIYTFEANLIGIENFEGKKALILDETYFYPEGGGQLSDQGQLGDYPIIDVQIKDDVIYHITSYDAVNLELNQLIIGTVNVERRRHFMQQHSGQHLFSGTAYNLFQVNTIGFHMSEDYVTVDFDKVLDQDAIDLIEFEANKTIQNNIEIIAHRPDPQVLEQMPLRKTPKVKENIRVIEIANYDYSPCGGTHPERTGEIGLIKVKRIDKYKKGIRITFICGLAAVKYVQACVNQQITLSKALAKPEFELLDGVNLLKDKSKEDKRTIIELEKELITHEIASHLDELDLVNQPCFITIEETGYPISRMREKINKMLTLENLSLLAINQHQTEAYLFIGLSQNLTDSIDIKKIINDCKGVLQFKGGGNETLIQGKTTDFDKLSAFIEAVSDAMNDALLKL